MSSLLEQAIIDATALKEAATKVAEKNLIDKYSPQIKEAVDKLLEQEEDPTALQAQPMDAASALENTPSDLSGMAAPEQPKDPLSKVKPSYLSSSKDDELITIDFSSIKPDKNAVAGGLSATPVPPPPPMGATPVGAAPASPSAPPAPEVGAPIQENVDLEENWSEDELEEEVELDEEVVIDVGSQDGEEMPCEGEGCNDMEEEVEISLNDEDSDDEMLEGGPVDSAESEATSDGQMNPGGFYEEELDEDLIERMVVDMIGRSDGSTSTYGLSEPEKRELTNVELARTQDEDYMLKQKEYEEALSASDKKLKKANKAKEALMQENMELKNTLLSLKEHLEKMNISNAKLLYTNRVLGSDSLNERQKNQIVETISRTESVDAARIAFETLQSAVQSVKEVKTPKSLNEAVSRSSSPFLVRPKAQESTYSDRMKVLAGIK